MKAYRATKFALSNRITSKILLVQNYALQKVKIYFSILPSGNREANYNQFLNDLMACGPEDCRYGLFDFEYEHQCQGTSERTKKEKLLLMSW